MSKPKQPKISSGVTTVLYRNSKARWIADPCCVEASKLPNATSHTFTLPSSAVDSSMFVSNWLSEYCVDCLTSSTIVVKDNRGLNLSISFLQGIACSKDLNQSSVVPIDIASTDDVKSVKVNNRGVDAVYETRYGCDFDLYINAGGPIWSTAFAPDSGIVKTEKTTSSSNYSKYLAVGLSRVGWPLEAKAPTVDGKVGIGSDFQRSIDQQSNSPNLLQIWHLTGSVIQHRQPVIYKGDKRGKASSASAVKKGRPKGSTKEAIARKKLAETESLESEDDEDYVDEDSAIDNIIITVADSISKKGEDDEDSEEEKPKAKKKKIATTTTTTTTTTKTRKPITNIEKRDITKSLTEYFEDIEDVVPPPDEIPEPIVRLAYGIHINRGAIWHAAWCPVNDNTSASIGVLAVVCEDGSCLVLLLPKHEASSSELSSIPVLNEESVCKIEIKLPDVNVTSIAWNSHKPFELLCGMSNGMVTGWSLAAHINSSTSGVHLEEPDFCLCDGEVDSMLPTFGAVNSLQICPYNANLLLSGSNDTNYRVWDINRPFLPMIVKQKHKMTHVEWDPCGIGYYCCDQATTSVTWEKQISESYDRLAKNTLYYHIHRFGGVWDMKAIIVDGHTYVISVASDGSVRAAFSSVVSMYKGPIPDTMVDLFRIANVHNDPTDKTTATLNVTREQQSSDSILLESFVESNNVAMHTVDTTLLLPSSQYDNIQHGSTHIVAYGGASGVLRVHTVNPLRLTFSCLKVK